MFDSMIRPLIDPPLNRAAQVLSKRGVTANGLTLAGLAMAFACFAALGFQHYGLALFFIALNRLCDGLDGPVARAGQKTGSDAGGFLDIVCDFIFYGGFVFFFALGQPESALAAAFLLFSILCTGTGFLAYAVIAAKRGETTQAQGKKSFFYSAGLMEGSETIFFFILMCLLPSYFAILAMIFGVLCLATAAGRGVMAYQTFSKN